MASGWEDIGNVVHATTLITNALIERTGAKVALVTTEGFADLIEIGREVRYDLYDLFLTMPEPLVPPQRRFEVRERTASSGDIITPLNQADLERAARRIADSGSESLAICFSP